MLLLAFFDFKNYLCIRPRELQSFQHHLERHFLLGIFSDFKFLFVIDRILPETVIFFFCFCALYIFTKKFDLQPRQGLDLYNVCCLVGVCFNVDQADLSSHKK